MSLVKWKSQWFIYKTAKLLGNSITVFVGEKKNKQTQLEYPALETIFPPSSTVWYGGLWWPDEQLQKGMRSRTVDRSALTISQAIMHAFKTRRQVQHIPKKASDIFRTAHSRENPKVLGLALSVHHDTRNKMLMDLLHIQNYCVSYSRT